MQNRKTELTRPTPFTAFLLALALVAGPLIVTPVVVHSTNVLDFSVGLLRALSGPLLIAAVLFLLIYLLLRHTGRWPRFNNRLSALTLAVAYLFWLQGHLLVWDYGVLDGRAIDWQAQWLRGLADTGLWLCVLLGAWFGARRLQPHTGLLAGALLLIYSITMFSSINNRKPAPAFHRYTLDATHKYDFSKQQNIFLIVVDAFQSDVFQELLDTRPELFPGFDGFTYYRNATAGFAKTYPSIPLMLTGQWYANAEPVTTFVERAYLDHSVTADMLEAGWRVDLFPDIPRVIHHDQRVASNVIERSDPVDVAAQSGHLADLSLFRVSPHFLKRFWQNDDQWRLAPAWAAWVENRSDDSKLRRARHPNAAARFALSTEQFGRVTWDQPAFKFYHLMVPHEPFLLREDFSVERWPAGREGYVGQSAATVRVLEKFIERLKALDIYNQSTIVIVADHGGGDYNAGVRAAGIVPEPSLEAVSTMSSQYHASALPLVLVKSAGAHGPLEISDAPVSIGNVAATLARAAGTAPRAGGAIGDPQAGLSSPRRYYFYRHSGWSGVYLPPMEEFEVTGHSWNLSDWVATGRILAPGGEVQRSRGYQIGTRVLFNGEGQASTWLSSGWSGAEARGTWSADREAFMRVPVADSDTAPRPTHAHFWLAPFLADGRIEAQSTTLSVGDTPVGSWRIRSPGCYAAPLPGAETLDRDTLSFRWSLPDAAAPNDFGLSDDFRLLGIYLMAMELGPAKTLPLDTDLTDLPAEQLACAFRVHGFSRESGTLNSNRTRASIWIQFDEQGLDTLFSGVMGSQTGGLELVMELSPFLGDGKLAQQRVILSSRGQTMADWQLESGGTYTVLIERSLLKDGVLDLEFSLPDATTPRALGINDDQRALGISIRALQLRVPLAKSDPSA